ncbi:hypothetical protein Kfla_6007 [Kribbella flavida DSM 17836]|uniref:Transmembrane protein n=1 Tax=Kribbella flavida (strain DSM 17836 / JCM 10339 / NBRC 14399) TaxID=479435 RepID=D2PSV8_KRIFD|nr:hypothetical protein [Kribbella flavida]ADB35010.1 hypothetical protein Kfla_6007 [Kribbella flavida DSM 17836]
MNRQRWTVLAVVCIALCLSGGVLLLIDGNRLSGASALLNAGMGVLLVRHFRSPGWTPPQSIPRWRMVYLWVVLLIICGMFTTAALRSSNGPGRWIAVGLITFCLAVGTTFTVAAKRLASRQDHR